MVSDKIYALNTVSSLLGEVKSILEDNGFNELMSKVEMLSDEVDESVDQLSVSIIRGNDDC